MSAVLVRCTVTSFSPSPWMLFWKILVSEVL